MAGKIPGEFVPLDVDYQHDRSIRAAGPLAECLFVRSLAYARKHKTAGFVPDYDLAVVAVGIAAPAKRASELVRERLWTTTKGGWRIRSFEKWNPTADESAMSAGGVLGNHTRWHVNKGLTSPDCPLCIAPESLPDSPPDDEPTIAPESGTDRVSSHIGERRKEKENLQDQENSSPSARAARLGLEVLR